MKIIPPSSNRQIAGFTRMHALVILGIGIIALVLLIVGVSPWLRAGKASFDQVSNGRQIYQVLRAYAADAGHDGGFPGAQSLSGGSRETTSSNDALAQLMPKYLDFKKLFFNRNSAYCRTAQVETPETRFVLRAGECDWAYVQGLKNSSNARWPLLASAFVPGTTSYVDDPTKKGRTYRTHRGALAVVIWVDGSSEIVETKENGDRYFVMRRDKPGANAFEKDGEWLAGDNVKVLHPK